MFGDGSLTFREFAMREALPLATVQNAILEFLRGREDAVLFGAQAVNAYLDEPRMTQDVDVLSTRAPELAEELRAYLHQRFQIAVRMRVVKEGMGYRLYQVRQTDNRHLADIRHIDVLPPYRRMAEVAVPLPAELIAMKVLSAAARRNSRKGTMDLADLRGLLLVFPELKTAHEVVEDRLREAGASAATIALWHQLVAEEILPDDEDAGF